MSTVPGSAGRPRGRGLVWLSRIYLLACVIGLVALLSLQGDVLLTLQPRAPAWALAAVMLVALTHLFAIAFTRNLLTAIGPTLSLQLAADVHIRFLPTRYLPGGIWHTLGRLEQLRRCGVPLSRVTLFPIGESIAAVSAALVLGSVLLVFPMMTATWMLGSVALLLACALFLIRWANPTAAPITTAGVAMLGFWICQQIAFGCFLMSIDSSVLAPPHATGCWLFAWALGHLAIFAPQGIGVSEVTFAHLLGGGLDVALLVTAFRLIQAMADTIVWLAWMAVRKLEAARLPGLHSGRRSAPSASPPPLKGAS